ncbi:hypothetical protein LSTR_LSTR007366 [Laodelphax striatellus]|uniref:Uncharacterized protein n=1 Tax=Laodelphax striatellus TaxID=195883 RepID=A0A482XPT9_LAOST|nr:hypothetical protein LSTR_LSTR007366 [Laodelphax striatellus]
MACKYIVFTTLLAFANAGFPVAPAYPGYAAPAYAAPAYAAPAAVTSQSSNILRSYGNLGQVSTHTKTIDTPYSSVSKSDVRVSNPGYATYAAAPAYHAPAAYAAPAYAAPVAYKAPVAAYAAPAYAAPVAYKAPVVAAPAYAAPAYHAPAAYAAPVAKVAGPALLGVAYSAAPVVSHMTYSNGLGINYAW